MDFKAIHKYKVSLLNESGLLVAETDFTNTNLTEGLDEYLSATLCAGTQHTSWYIGLKKTAGDIAAADTLASHIWTEADPGTDYTGDRQAWTPGSISSGSVSNAASQASFPCLTNITIYGAFLCSVATGSSGILFGIGDFATSLLVQNGYTLNVQATITIV